MKSKKASENIREFHHGERYKKAVKKYGKAHAEKIAQAAGFSAARRASAKGHSKGY
jgi:hypothetical protein